MIAEMRGAVPQYSALLARTHLREAWTDIRNQRGWSFQLGNGGFSSPSLINGGSCTIPAFGATVVTPDATAKPLWLAGSQFGSLLTQRQFRVGASTIYNIIALDSTTGAITLDRAWTDITFGAGLGYTIYQCYYPVPVKDFEAWESVVNVTNVMWLNISPSKGGRDWADRNDPQRQIFALPTEVIPYQVDGRANSSTAGFMMYELYPQPQAQYAFQTWFTRSGADLVNGADTLPYPITEDVLKALARVKAYEWAEANKDAANPRGAGADYRFLMGSAKAQADEQLKEIRMLDRDRVDMWSSRLTRLAGYGPLATFNPATGMVSSRNT